MTHINDTEIHVGDIGTKLYLEITEIDIAGVVNVVPIDNAILKKILLRKPGGTITEYDGVLYTDGTDGIMYYETADATDLDEDGVYKIEGKVQLTNGTWHTTVKQFRVHDILVPTV